MAASARVVVVTIGLAAGAATVAMACTPPPTATASTAATNAPSSSNAIAARNSAAPSATSSAGAFAAQGTTHARTPPAPPRQIAAGGDVTCAVLADQTVRCWGDDQFLLMGGGADRARRRPVRLAMPAPVVQVAVGAVHACARHVDATVSCWGSNYAGEIGLGTPTNPPGDGIAHATLVPGVRGVTAVAANAHTAVLLADRTVMFWGDWDSGSGDPRPAGSAKPALIAKLADVVEIADTGMGACARLASGAVRCWYDVSPGLIPRGKDRVDPVPAPVKDALWLAPSSSGMCAMTSAHKLVCWTVLVQRLEAPYPGLAKVADAVELAIGQDGACARRTSGEVVCEEQTASGSGSGIVKTLVASGATQIVAGSAHFCALVGADVLCWGRNTWGQLGDGTTTQRTTPTRVVW